MSRTMEIRPGMSPEQIYEQMEPIEDLKVELLGGRLVMTGGASIRHARVVMLLMRTLWAIADSGGWEVLTDVSLHVAATRDRPKPDVVVVPRGAPQYDKNEFYAHGVLLVAEVVSPGSQDEDRHGKPRYYAQGKVPLYLLVDIEATPPSVTLFARPKAGKYQDRVTVEMGQALSLPLPIGVTLDTEALAD